MGIIKTGFGTLGTGRRQPTTPTPGDTTVNEGTLVLNKGTAAAGGVRAMSGRLYVGDNTVTSGYASCRRRPLAAAGAAARLRRACVDLRTTGFVDLNGKNETIGNADAQTGLDPAGRVRRWTRAAGTLTVNGNLTFNAAEGAALWTPVAPATISGKLNLGGVVRGIDIGDRTELPYDLIISADISGTGGINKTDTGTLLLSGNSTYSGDTVLTAGALAAGSDTAFGTSQLDLPASGTSLIGVGGARALGNELYFSGTTALGSIVQPRRV